MGFVKSAWRATWKDLPVHVSSNGLTHGFHVQVAGKTAIQRVITLGGGSGHWEGDVDVEGSKAHVVVEILGTLTDSECELWIEGEKIVLEREA
jgi:hypothetical protein